MKTKKYLSQPILLAVILLFSANVFSQISDSSSFKTKENSNINKSENREDATLQEEEIESSFPGGNSSWKRYLQNKLNANVPVKNNAPDGTYEVIVRFIVGKSGEIRDVIAETKHGFGMEEEAIRVVKNSPKWNAGSQKGVPVNSVRRQPLTFIVVDDQVFTKVDKPAEFPGGIYDWESFLKKTLDAEVPTRNKAPKEQYAVIVRFVIKKDGKVDEVEPLTKLGFGMEEEVVKVIKKSPDWIPAMIDGKPVNSYQKQTIAFYVSKNPERKKTGEELLKPQIPPSFPGTIVDWRNYLRNNLDDQVAYFNSAPAGRYKVLIEFTVDVDGSVSDVTAKSNHGYGMEKEAKRVIKNSPKWNPGIINGQPVKSKHTQPFVFVVRED